MQRLPSSTACVTVARDDRRSGLPRGFTLVEMLVAVALVMLLMALFAQVFQIAGGTVSTQRGLMENDQRARSVQTLLIGDLHKRTFRKVIPFTFNEDLSAPEAELVQRQGYFYISENDPANDTDDVLAFTVNALVKIDTPEDQPYFGKAIPLIEKTASNGLAYLRLNTNQPEHDDERLDVNNSADSPAAEVAYFLRGGNLYRRVLLIRKQLDRLQELQPMTNAGEKFFGRNTSGTILYPDDLSNATQFWNDFDFSAHPRIIRNPNDSSQLLYDGAEFSGTLDSLPLFPTLPQMSFLKFPLALAYPPNRFGHDTINPTPLLSPPGFPFGGQPREYGLGGVNSWFVGRLTMQESSNTLRLPPPPVQPTIIPWTYPHLTHVVPNFPPSPSSDLQNPMNAAVVWHDRDGDLVIDEFASGTRRGEDLVLSHVHAFDVKVWDEALGEFVDIGHARADASNNPIGDFHLSRRLNTVYGPRTTADINAGIGLHNRVFDTWYPFRTEDVNGSGSLSLNDDTNNNGIQDPGETDSDGDGVWDRSEDISGGTAGALDHIQLLDFNADGVITSVDHNGDGVVDAGENFPPYRPLVAQPRRADVSSGYVPYERWIPSSASPNRYTVGSRVFPSVYTDRTQFGDPFYYICVSNDANQDGTFDGQGSVEPLWPRIEGMVVTDGDLHWQAVDNRKRLRAIQITLRFLDPTTQQLRTLTIQHSLVD